LGVCNYYLEQFPEAITYFKKAEETKSDDELCYYLGTGYYSMNRYPEAITYLKKALEANHDDAGAYAIIGTSNYLLGHLALAKENLDKARGLFKNQGNYLKAKEIEDYLSSISNIY
jgi:tetratricopeptide (TPR) repeat protein